MNKDGLAEETTMIGKLGTAFRIYGVRFVNHKNRRLWKKSNPLIFHKHNA